MQQYQIKGATKATGFDVSVIVTASSLEHAGRIAAERDILVESVEPFPPAPAEPSLDYQPRRDARSTTTAVRTAAAPKPEEQLSPPSFSHPKYSGLEASAVVLYGAAILWGTVASLALIVTLLQFVQGSGATATQALIITLAALFQTLIFGAASSAISAFRDIAINSFAWRQSAPPPAAR